MQVHTLISSENGPIILWVMYPHRGDELEHTADSIRELVGEEQFTLVAIQIDDWTATVDLNLLYFIFIRRIYLPDVPRVRAQCGIRDLWNM